MNELEIQTIASEAAIAIRTKDDYDEARRILGEINDAEKRVSEVLDPTVKAADEALKAARANRARYLQPLADAKALLKLKMGEWVSTEQRRIAEEARAAEEAALEAAAEAAMSGAEVEIAVPEPAPAKIAGTRTTWSAQVIDIKALARAVADGAADPNYILPNQTLLNTAARTAHDSLNIPGVKAVSQTGVTA